MESYNGVDYINGDYKQGFVNDSRICIEYPYGYYVKDETYCFYVPKNCNPDTAIVSYRSGDGVYGDSTLLPNISQNSDAQFVTDYLQNNDIDAVIIMKYNFEHDGSDDEKIFGLINEIKQNEGIQTTSVGEVAFSSSYSSSIRGAIANINNNPGIEPQKIILVDGLMGGVEKNGLDYIKSMSENDIQTLGNNNARILAFEKSAEKNDTSMLYNLQKLKNAGAEVAIVFSYDDSVSNGGQHVAQRNIAIQDGALSLAAGNVECFDKVLSNSKSEVYMLDDNGQLVQVTDVNVLKKFFSVKEIKDIETGMDQKEDGDFISVEYSFVSSYLKLMLSAINNANISKVSNIATTNDGSFTFAAANNAFNNYSNMSSTFLKSLGNTYGSILQIADSMYNLDSELAGDVSAIDSMIGSIESQDLGFADEFFANNLFDPAKAFDISDNDNEIKITREGLLNAISDNNIVMSTLLQDIADTKEIKQTIDSFMSDSVSTLQGDAWDKVRNKLGEYDVVCDQKIKYANVLIDGLTAAYQKLLDYLEDYDELDTSKIPEIEKNIKDIEEQIISLQSQYDALNSENGVLVCSCDDKGNVLSSYTIDNSSLMAQVSALIDICLEIKQELNRNLDKLNGLHSADKNASEEITEAENTDKPEIDQIDNTAGSNIPVAPVAGAVVAGTEMVDIQEEKPQVADEISQEKPQVADEISQEKTQPSGGEYDGGNTNSQMNQPSQSEPVVSDNISEEYFAKYEDIKTNDNMLVYNVNDECKLIIHHEGNTILGMEYYYDFGNKDNAINMLTNITAKYEDMSGYNGIIINDRYVKIVFSPEFFQNQDLIYFMDIFSGYKTV